MAIKTSLHQGMLFKLRWEWLNFNKAVINIQVRLSQVGNKSVRIGVPLSKAALGELRRVPRAPSSVVIDCSVNAVRILGNQRLRDLGMSSLR